MTQQQYKTWTLWLLIATVTALVVTAAMLSLGRGARAAQANAPEEPGTAYYTPNPAPSQENSETAGENNGSRYLVALYRGHIGVFQEGQAAPVLTADTDVYLLPEEDIRLLKEGIPAATLGEARRILEDYD